MAVRVKLLVASALIAAALEVLAGTHTGGHQWPLFLFYLVAVLLTSGMKVCLLKTDSTMSVNFPFILLAVVQLSPLQAIAVAALSVFAQCKVRVQKFFSLVQIGFNVANVINATAACRFTYVWLRQLHIGVPPALAAGGIVYFFANTIPLAFIIAWTSNRKALALWRGDFSWFLPFYLVGAALAAFAYFLDNHYGLLTGLLLVPVAYTMYRAYNAQVARIRDTQQHLLEMDALHMRTIESLAMAIEAKDQETHDHLLRVRVYVTEVGKALNLSEAEMQAVATAALLHDIGKLAVPERIINKPGKLTPDEFEKMKIHPSVGAEILERVRFPYPVVPIVRAHHEWWNGMGYPDGLKGEAIPMGARILSVVDSFDAMASDRPYRLAMPLSQAMDRIKEMAGTQFDPRVVHLLEQRYVELEELARQEGAKLHRLDTEVHVARGLAPGAGFEQADGVPPSERHGFPESDPFEGEGGLRAAALPLQSASLLAERLQLLMLRTADSSGGRFVLEETLAISTLRLHQTISFECLAFYLLQGEELIAQSGDAFYGRYFSAGGVPVGSGISGWVGKHEQSIVNGNATVEPHYIPQGHPELELRSALALPLRNANNTVFGVLSLYAHGENAFSRDDLRTLEAVEPALSLAFVNSIDEHEKVSSLGDDQAATALMPQLEQALKDCRRQVQSLGLLLAEPSVAKRFGDCSAQGSEPSLLWGNLSAFLVPGESPVQVAARISEVRAGLPRFSQIAEGAVGFACFPEDGETAEALLACAGRRMYLGQLQGQPSAAGVA